MCLKSPKSIFTASWEMCAISFFKNHNIGIECKKVYSTKVKWKETRNV